VLERAQDRLKALVLLHRGAARRQPLPQLSVYPIQQIHLTLPLADDAAG
jgi:hypothetical protein